MASLREFTCEDLLRFANVNLDAFTETYNTSFYTMYLCRWPEYCAVAEGLQGRIMGYGERVNESVIESLKVKGGR